MATLLVKYITNVYVFWCILLVDITWACPRLGLTRFHIFQVVCWRAGALGVVDSHSQAVLIEECISDGGARHVTYKLI